jgi:thimet oligopeptidase
MSLGECAQCSNCGAITSHSQPLVNVHWIRHIMHGLCSEGTGNSTRLAKCPRDFVEAPSQMLENWCWQKSVLERLSKHYQSGKPLPDELLQSMIKAKHVGVAFSSLRQIYLSRLDLTIHGLDPPTDSAGLQSIVDDLRPKICLVDNPTGNNILRTFGHLMKQYSASYVRSIVHDVELGVAIFLTFLLFSVSVWIHVGRGVECRHVCFSF